MSQLSRFWEATKFNTPNLKKDLYSFLRISRVPNLVITFVSFALGAFIANKHSFQFLQHTIFWAVGIGIVLIAAGGYWINDVYDFRIDRINKPERTVINTLLSVKKVVTVHIVMHTILFVSLVFITQKLMLIMIGAALLLFIYAAWLKRTTLLGNVTVAFLTALVIMMAGFIYTFNAALVWTAIFAFQINLIREIVKDIEDIEGDVKFNLQTLPIQIGIFRTRIIMYILYLFLLVCCWMPFLLQDILNTTVSVLYIILSFFLFQVPAIGLMLHLSHSKTTKDYTAHSKMVKWLMLSGMITLLLL